MRTIASFIFITIATLAGCHASHCTVRCDRGSQSKVISIQAGEAVDVRIPFEGPVMTCWDLPEGLSWSAEGVLTGATNETGVHEVLCRMVHNDVMENVTFPVYVK